MKKIRVISMGEIVTPNLNNGLNALAEIVAQKKNSEAMLTLTAVFSAVKKNEQAIQNFKQGLISENEFDKLFIETIYNETQVTLTSQEFNLAWSAMNPKYVAFKQALETVAAFNAKNDQQLIFISYTNPKDIKHLTNELKLNGIPHELDKNDNLCEISGIKLHTTCFNKTTKQDLISDVIVELRKSTDTNKLFPPAKNDTQSSDIKYIHGTNEITFETLRKDFEKTATSVQTIVDKFQIDSILWNKKSVSLSDILNEDKPVHGLVAASKL